MPFYPLLQEIAEILGLSYEEALKQLREGVTWST